MARFYYNEETRRFDMPEEEYLAKKFANVNEAPTVLFMGNGWPDKKRQSEDRHKRNLAANPLYTTTNDWNQRFREGK